MKLCALPKTSNIKDEKPHFKFLISGFINLLSTEEIKEEIKKETENPITTKNDVKDLNPFDFKSLNLSMDGSKK